MAVRDLPVGLVLPYGAIYRLEPCDRALLNANLVVRQESGIIVLRGRIDVTKPNMGIRSRKPGSAMKRVEFLDRIRGGRDGQLVIAQGELCFRKVGQGQRIMAVRWTAIDESLALQSLERFDGLPGIPQAQSREAKASDRPALLFTLFNCLLESARRFARSVAA